MCTPNDGQHMTLQLDGANSYMNANLFHIV